VQNWVPNLTARTRDWIVAEADVQINWGATGTADIVSAARRTMQVGGRPVHTRPAGPLLQPAALPTATVGQHANSLKKLKAIGNAAGVPSIYALATLLLVGVGLAGIWRANVAFAPEMYAEQGMVPAAKANAAGQNYAVFDLNLNIRRWREEQVARFTETPDVLVMGASHWQEAHAGLVRSERMFNGHVHRDYWEDMLGVAEVYVRNKRLPKRIILSIRDNLFTPIEDRKDFLWEPGIPNYRMMADRLGLAKQSAWKTYPFQRVKERLSLAMLYSNVTRWYNSIQRPQATTEAHFDHLDTLLPDGSILWSADHMAVFTPERARKEALSFAAARRNDPPKVDPKGLKAIDALLTFLKAQGTEVVLVHPPFNPVFYDAVQGGSYPKGLDRIRQITKDLAAKHGLHIIGEFDPAKVGCTAEMYIDAEHGNPACLQKIFDQYEALLPKLKAATTKGQS
jgi:hypothetical protein